MSFLKLGKNFRHMDHTLFFVIAALTLFGLFSLYSVSAFYAANRQDCNFDSLYFVKKQLIWIFAGIAAGTLAMRVNLEKLRPLIKPAVIATVILLVITLFCPPVKKVRRWIPLGFMNFQASELAKIMLALYFADYFDRNLSKILNGWKGLVKPFGLTAVMLILISLQPDLGAPILMFGVSLFVFFAAGVKVRYIVLTALTAVPAGIYELFRHEYRIKRLKAMLSPMDSAVEQSHQLVQSLLAVGSGGWFGKGPGASQLKLLYLPEAHTDYIFPIMAEELGLVGALFITLLFFMFLVRGLKISQNASSFFYSIVALGITLTITFQAFFNIGMSIGLLPTKGVGLPFFSYGGSSIVLTLFSAGLLLNISMNRNMIK
ncbi:MAG: putative lipid II flippase FtsW [Elusimicrobia bacterium]|nr:putative lipid II flippase FtsW [Elusimicrobiota bacterium]